MDWFGKGRKTAEAFVPNEAMQAKDFSLQTLSRHAPGLAARFTWGTNEAPVTPCVSRSNRFPPT